MMNHRRDWMRMVPAELRQHTGWVKGEVLSGGLGAEYGGSGLRLGFQFEQASVLGVDVGKQNLGADVAGAVGGGQEGERGHHQRLARLTAEGERTEV